MTLERVGITIGNDHDYENDDGMKVTKEKEKVGTRQAIAFTIQLLAFVFA
jgi:hypothetical protein